MRLAEDLRNVDDPAWPALEAVIRESHHPVQVLPVDPARGEATLVQLQVTARSTLGALALHTGGLLVDDGWLRVLGGGDPSLNLATANGLDHPPEEAPGQLLVAFDVLGGSYAVNGGALPGAPGQVCYFAPDELRWVPLEMGHGSFVAWAMTDRLALFNEHLRWPGWEAEVAALTLAEGIAVYPFPFTEEGRDLSRVSRRPASIAELLTIWEELGRKLGGPDGS